jgi:hypothetical protein
MQVGTNRALTILAALLGVTFIVTTGAVGTVGAQKQAEEPSLAPVFDAGDTVDTAWGISEAALAGAFDRLLYGLGDRVPEAIQSRLGTESQTAGDLASGTQSLFNRRNATLVEYVNRRTNISENRTMQVTWQYEDETATRYVVTNASDGNVTRARMVTSTDRPVDATATLCGFAARESRAELKRFIDEFAEPGVAVDAAYLDKVSGRYGPNVEASFFPTSGSCEVSS